MRLSSVTPRFRSDDDQTLIGFWNEREGSITWLTELEHELERRGYEPRDTEGKRRSLSLEDGLS